MKCTERIIIEFVRFGSYENVDTCDMAFFFEEVFGREPIALERFNAQTEKSSLLTLTDFLELLKESKIFTFKVCERYFTEVGKSGILAYSVLLDNESLKIFF